MLPGMLDVTESQLRVPARTGMPVRLSHMPGELVHPDSPPPSACFCMPTAPAPRRAAESNSLRAKLRAIFAASF